MKILFMGTPEFARDQLTALWENREAHGWDIVGVISQPDKPKGRGMKMIPPPVKVFAEEQGIPVYQQIMLSIEITEADLKKWGVSYSGELEAMHKAKYIASNRHRQEHGHLDRYWLTEKGYKHFEF